MSLYRPISWAAATAMLAACTEGITTAPPVGPSPVSESAKAVESGTSSNITMGMASTRGSAHQPYVVIDGVPRGQGSGPLEGIDPKDIESVEVLKGPVAMQRFGAEAANGVIVIRTKSGSRDRPASEAPSPPPARPR